MLLKQCYKRWQGDRVAQGQVPALKKNLKNSKKVLTKFCRPKNFIGVPNNVTNAGRVTQGGTGAGAGIVMEMSTSRDLNAHLRAMQCAQRSFTQEMDRGRRQHGRPRHANNPRPPKHNVL